MVVFEKPKTLTDAPLHYCPGCTHGIIHRLVAEVIDELGIDGRTIGVAPVGCSVMAYDYFTCDFIQAPHGRAPAVATGVNFSGAHAVTVWGYEIDNATGLLTKLYMTDSDDRATELKEYIVEAVDNITPKIRLKGYTTYYPMNLYPVSGYGTAGK